MDERSLSRSRAEVLFAELLVDEPDPEAERVEALCAEHPELAGELRRMHAELQALRTRLPGWAAPAGEDAARASRGPPELGGFRCLRLLGRGGMGEVWEAEDLELGRRVAVKLLRDSWMASEAQLQRFQREAEAAGRVQHPAIVAVYQTGEWEGRRYIVQELVPGGRTLREEIAELQAAGEPPADHARRVAERFAALADALAAAHAVGIVHRDLKPGNVLLTPRGEPKLADFGLALLTDEVSLSRTGEFLGTCYYTSPEQMSSDGGRVDERSDVFSLGATLYENLTLRRPFEGDSVQSVARALLSDDPTPPHRVRARLPRDLSLICMKALEKRREARYASMAELRSDLRRFLAHEPIHARPPSAPRRAAKWARRHPVVTTALGLSLAASVSLAALYLRSERLRREVSEKNLSLSQAGDDLRVENASRAEVIDFLTGMFEANDPDISGDQVPSLREVLDRAVRRIEAGEVSDPRVRASLLACLGSVSGQLGDWRRSRKLLEEALELWKGRGEGDGRDATSATLALVAVLAKLGELPAAQERLAPLVARVDADPDFEAHSGAVVLLSLGDLCRHTGRPEESERAFERAAALCADRPTDDRLWIRSRTARAALYLQEGRLDEARALYQAVVDADPELLERGEPQVLEALNGLSLVLLDQGHLEEAEAACLELCDRAEGSLGPDHPEMLVARNNLARVWEAMQRYADAEQVYREIIDTLGSRFGARSTGVLRFENNLGTCLVRQGRLEEAEEVHREVWSARRELYADDVPDLLNCQNNLAYDLYRLGKLDEALTLEEEVVERTPSSDANAKGRRDLLESIRTGIAAR